MNDPRFGVSAQSASTGPFMALGGISTGTTAPKPLGYSQRLSGAADYAESLAGLLAGLTAKVEGVFAGGGTSQVSEDSMGMGHSITRVEAALRDATELVSKLDGIL